MLRKLGQQFEVTASAIQSAESIMVDYEINERFLKFAKDLKKLTPKSEDFLYFSTRYITAAEASLINDDGSAKLDRDGKPLTANWEQNGDSLKWVCSDTNVRPYKNQNGDIFPEIELLKAHKKWVSRPLCVDHKSDTVDAVRGIILDSYYDRVHKCAIALIALDKISFPELARGVQSGYKTSVSMGTRVAKAICTDCGQVASTERDFCQHMRTKSGFGEINTGLDPIEISIVVSGADHQAKIRTILAAANSLRTNIEAKEQEIDKLALTQASTDKFKELDEDLRKISEKLADLKANLEQEDTNTDNDAAYGQTGDLAMKETVLPNTDQSFDVPNRLAMHNDVLRSELQDLTRVVSSKFRDMENSLSTLSHKIKEEIMSVNSNHGVSKEGYFQGAGGVNEPAPHQVKYPKEPLNEQLRDHGDKQMNADNMGPVDGMFPGDKEKKALVQRAEVEERAMRRAAALNKAKENLMKSKEAYWNSGVPGNDPTPGKPQYAKDPLNEKDRNKEDKQMVGAKPFPGVGDVDGLYGDDLKIKQLHNRASLKARFLRVAAEDGTQDLGESAWEVSRDGDVLFTATVDEITGGNVEGLYDVVASRDFATKMLEKVYKVGAEQASKIYKSAQAVSGMGAPPLAAPDMGGAASVPPMPDMGAAMPAGESATNALPQEGADSGSEGDPKEVALKLATEMRDRASDLLEAVRVLTGEQSEMGELDGLNEKAASADFKKLVSMKKTLNASLVTGMKKAIAELNEHREELNLIADILEDGSVSTDYTNSVVEEALVDAKSAIADTHDLMRAFIKYANGSAQLAKQAQMMDVQDADVALEDANDANLVFDKEGGEVAEASDGEECNEEGEDMNDVMMDVNPEKLKNLLASDLSTKEARAEARAKLAAQAVEFSPMLDQANALANGQTQLDVKPSNNLGRVETLEEKHQAMLGVAEAPPKVRKEAARLNQLIVEGKVAKEDLDHLVAQGLDSEVVKYWKQFWGQAGKEGSEFASELLKEHAKAQIDNEINTYKVKIARAYELTNEMVRRGLVADERSAITAHVEDMMSWNDEGFEAMKRVVNKHPLQKSASFPQVGMIGTGEPVSQAQPELSLQDALDQVFSSRKFSY